MNIPTDSRSANPYADRAGLARLHSGHWFVYERVQACKRETAAVEPCPTHVALEGMNRTVCGRKVTLRFGTSPTDTISMVECSQCKTYLETKTL